MKGNGNDLPRLAMWLLKHACPGSDREALTGDVVEEFCTGRSPAWLWKQVLVAIAITVPTRIRRNWPLISYALAGAAITLATSNNYYLRAQGVAHWWILPFPLSMFVYLVSPAALLASGALPILAAALLLNGGFGWRSLFRICFFSLRTWLCGLVFITVGPFLVLLPNPNPRNVLPAGPLMVFYTLLASAWLGCRSANRLATRVK
jgi:hypothetical protein